MVDYNVPPCSFLRVYKAQNRRLPVRIGPGEPVSSCKCSVRNNSPPLRLVGAGWGWVVVVVWLGSGWLGSG